MYKILEGNSIEELNCKLVEESNIEEIGVVSSCYYMDHNMNDGIISDEYVSYCVPIKIKEDDNVQ